MSVEVNIPQSFQHLAGGARDTQVNGGTVGECLAELISRFPEIKPQIFTRRGKLHGYIDIFVNKASSYPEELTKPVADGDKLHIVNIIAGG